MTIVFVHGVPETAEVWDPLVAQLLPSSGASDHAADEVLPRVVSLALPGFGGALPNGFEPTMERYAAWLADELAALPVVDLVGHDWGALLSLRVLSDRPATVRSWAIDAGDLDPTFRWHDTARLWQTPGEGEAAMDAFVGASVADRAAMLAGFGVPEAHAAAMAGCIDTTMGAAILALYRSAVDIGVDWGPGIDRIDAPGLLVASGRDPFRSARRARQLAKRTGADLIELPEAGHWWMLDDPAGSAEVLRSFWRRVSP